MLGPMGPPVVGRGKGVRKWFRPTARGVATSGRAEPVTGRDDRWLVRDESAQCELAFSMPTPVSDRTSSSAYFALLYSLLMIVPR